MKQFHKLFFTVLFVFAACISVTAQNRFFSEASQTELNKISGKRTIIPQKYRAVTVNSGDLKAFLWSLPNEKTLFNRNQAPIMELPMPDGSSARFRVWESSIQEPGLEAKFLEIRTFLGQGITDPYATIRFDYTDFGFHAQILSVNGNIYMDPYARGNVNNYISYYGRENERESRWTCQVADNLAAKANAASAVLAGPCRGTQLYTYRLAVGCTHQYAAAVGGTTPALLHSAIVTTVNRVVGVYENEITVRMVLVANNNIIEFLTAGSDPYTGNDDAGTLIGESQTVITNAIGNPNFDIGHTFSTGGGGLAGLGVVCINGQKASGITGSPSPVGDDYDIDYVAHEMGHQFGGNHSFNSVTANCGGGNRNGSTAYEPGSGTTIMAYAGICTSDDIQPHSDPYFHSISFDEISNYIEAGGASCRVVTPTGNTLPQIVSMNNNTANIPINTPFTLTASATDADGDPLTYNWEEWDLSPSGGAWNSGAASTTAPLFKSRIPKTTGSRTFPDIARIIANYLPATPPAIMGGLKGETLPTVARAMKFRLTVRDNRAGGGGIVTGGNGCQTGFTGVFQVNTIAGTGPFIVTVPNGGESYTGGSTQTITWNVAGTAAAPISAANVKISLSTDGGQTYPTVIAASTANDGSEALTIPTVATTTARVKIEAIGNVFFDISNANFTITAPTQTYTFNAVSPASVPCGTATASITLGTTSVAGFSTPINMSATGNPAGTTVSFNPTPVTPGNNSIVTLNNMNTLVPGTYTITVTGVAGAVTQTAQLTYTVQPGTPPSITTQPTAATVCEGSNATFTVVAGGTGLSYQWQVSTGGPFTDIAGATSSSYTITGAVAGLNNNQYHVIVSTLCGSTTTNNVILTVNTATAIATQPANAAVCAGSDNTFTVSATGTGLSYQWQQSTTGCGGSFTDIPAANSASYTLSGVTLAQNGYAYRAVVTGSCAPFSINSNCALLTVTGSVNISTQPTNVIVCSGADAIFTVAASGTGVSYQWQVSTGGPFTDITGATNSTLTLTGVTAAANGNQYQAVVTNASCATGATSSIATLTVNALPAVTTQPISASVCVGSNAIFTSAASGTGITYQWQVSSGGPFTDIPGATNASYTATAVTAGMNNNQYHVVISGTCAPAATSSNATLTVISAAAIATQPSNASACEGSDANLTVAGTAPGTDQYQWQVSTGGPFANIAGATNATLTLTNVTAAMNGNQYQVIISNTCPGSVTSSAVTLTVNTTPSVNAVADALSVCSGSQVQLTASGAVDYSWTPAGSLNDPSSATPTATPEVDPGNPGVPSNIVYTVTGTGANGCSSTATVTITANPLLTVTLTATPSVTSLLPGQSVLLTANVTPAGTYAYTWFNGAVTLANTGSTLTVNAGEVGDYMVIADAGTGFCAQSSNIITVTDSTSKGFYIYPNPNDGQFTIDLQNPGGLPIKRNVVVYDSKGARVFIKAIATSSELEHVHVDLRPAASDTYIIVIYDGSGTMLISDRVVVRH